MKIAALITTAFLLLGATITGSFTGSVGSSGGGGGASDGCEVGEVCTASAPTATGWAWTGVTLSTSCANPITTGGTYDSCQWNSTLTISATSGTVNITRSWLRGGIDTTAGGTTTVNLTDVEVGLVSSPSVSDAINTSNGMTVNSTRVHCHDSAKCWSGYSPQNVTLSYCHDLYGFCTDGCGGDDSHNECVLFTRGDQSVTYSNLVANYGQEEPGSNPGMSAVLVLYSHGVFDDVDNVLIQGNRFTNSDGAVYCTYSGNSTDADPTNVDWLDNTYVTGGCSGSNYNTGWLRASDGGTGNSWSGNQLSDSTPLSEPGSSNY